MPAISTRRLARSITKKTWYRTSPAQLSSSTVKKSAAAMALRCALMNVVHEYCRRRRRRRFDALLFQDPLDRVPTYGVPDVL
jgi:hypothetical protein